MRKSQKCAGVHQYTRTPKVVTVGPCRRRRTFVHHPHRGRAYALRGAVDRAEASSAGEADAHGQRPGAALGPGNAWPRSGPSWHESSRGQVRSCATLPRARWYNIQIRRSPLMRASSHNPRSASDPAPTRFRRGSERPAPPHLQCRWIYPLRLMQAVADEKRRRKPPASQGG